MNEQAIENTEQAVDKQKAPAQEHFIVAIGASAGGLEAIHAFFDNITKTTNLSFIIIQHLSPDYKSLLVELVAKHTHMKVYEAQHNLEVKRNCIYVIPPRKIMMIADGRLQLSEKNKAIKVLTQLLTLFCGRLQTTRATKPLL